MLNDFWTCYLNVEKNKAFTNSCWLSCNFQPDACWASRRSLYNGTGHFMPKKTGCFSVPSGQGSPGYPLSGHGGHVKYLPVIALFIVPAFMARADGEWLQQKSQQTSKKIIAEVASGQKKQSEQLCIRMKISELRVKIAAENDLQKKQKLQNTMSRLEKQLRQR